MNNSTIDWETIGPVLIAALVTLRVGWFFRKQKSWELFLLSLLLALACGLNLGEQSLLPAHAREFTYSVYAILALIAIEPEIYWLLYTLKRKMSSRFGVSLHRMLDELVAGAQILASTKTGALIAFERNDNLDKLAQSGTPIHSDVRKELLTAIFSKEALTHDGGAIIRNGRMAYCSAIFPLTFNLEIDKNLGTRHRAAIGLTEVTDAVCLIVSEEEGTVSLAKDGRIFYNLDQKAVRKNLTQWLLEKPKKRTYPFHHLRTFRITENSSVALRFMKSFALQLYDLILLLFWTLLGANMLLAEKGNLTQETLRQFLSAHHPLDHPWPWIFPALVLIHSLFFFLRLEMAFDLQKGNWVKETGILFLTLHRTKRSFPDLSRVIVRRESQKAPLWSLLLEDKKRKLFRLDSSGSPNGLLAAARKIHELIRIELVNQS